ncbi:CACTA en-spm transposon protein [Cucumis melo var. makuwa]|uniref:CACTA en-spm transposon protein n=1 Tax=Cucumis melo var. makuwa TaxID=1194695 RepID=A0A5A7VH70_CUCMM|nr:CACTA en-spm transposon protein [Cucumis melo var. makuwa]
MRHVTDDFIDDANEHLHMKVEQVTTNDSDEPHTHIFIMSSFPSDFDKMDVMFLEFADKLNNPAGGSSSMGENSNTSQPSATSTLRRRAQSRLLVLESYIAANGQIPMMIAPGMEKHIGREYIEVVKGNLQRCFVFDFNDQAINRFVEYQILNTFKEFWGDYHRHFKKYSDPEEARANPPHLLNQMLELQSQPTPEGTQPLFGDEICKTVLDRRSNYSKGLG